MANFKVTNGLNGTNNLTHNKSDFGGKQLYLKLNQTVYLSCSDNNIGPGHIGLSITLRTKLNLGFNDLVQLSEYKITNKTVPTLGLKVISLRKEATTTSDIKSKITSLILGHYSYPGQYIILPTCLLHVTNGEGFITDNTNLEFIAGDNLTLAVDSQFKVTKVISEQYAWENKLNHNSKDFDNQKELYLKINNSVVYKSIAVDLPSILPGQIGISQIVRNKLSLGLGDPIIIVPYSILTTKLTELPISVSLLTRDSEITSAHEDELKDNIKSHFTNHYFYPNQILLYKRYILKATKEGFLISTTKIEIISEDTKLNIISCKLLKRDLFRDDYNFEEIGIGGLNKELTNIFRRALSTRGIPSSTIKKLGLEHIKGILLHGPPGTGKTLIARKIGSMISEKPPKVVNGPEILNKFVGQSEENIRKLFSEAEVDQKHQGDDSPLHVIIFDEIDAICRQRGRSTTTSSINDSLVNQLLTMIQGYNSLNNIFIIAITNRIDLLDPALIRPGRIEVHIKIGLADESGRAEIFRIHTNKMGQFNMLSPEVSIPQLASLTENYSGAEIEAVVKNAASSAIQKLLASQVDKIEDNIIVTMDHFYNSITEIVPAFGSSQTLEQLLPGEFYTIPTHQDSYKSASLFFTKPTKFKTVLITGSRGTGKTTMAGKLAAAQNIKCTKIIRAIDTVYMDETAKANHIAETITGSYISEHSLVIVDDIEIAINYAKIGYTTNFSNKLYQTLLTVLKTEPIDNHNLILIVTCGDEELKPILEGHFDLVISVGLLQEEDLNYLVKTINIKRELVGGELVSQKFEEVSIKNFLNSL